MRHSPEFFETDTLFLAGQRVSPGKYREVGGNRREINIDNEDVLPASLDGRVACYYRVQSTWQQIAQPQLAAA
jgi:hypothetical protein